MTTTAVLAEIVTERARQDDKWGEQHHTDFVWHAILAEEVGEVAEAILEGRQADVRRELIQVAAVAVFPLWSLVVQSARPP